MSSQLLHGVAAVVFLLTWVLVWQIIVRGQRDVQHTASDASPMMRRDSGNTT